MERKDETLHWINLDISEVVSLWLCYLLAIFHQTDRPTCPPLPFLPEHGIALFSSTLSPIRASASAAHRHTVTIRWCTADTPPSYLQVSDVGHIQTPDLRGKCAVLVPCRAKRYLSIRHPIASFRLRLIGNHQRHPILRDALYC
jgi:hypothetical protein